MVSRKAFGLALEGVSEKFLGLVGTFFFLNIDLRKFAANFASI